MHHGRIFEQSLTKPTHCPGHGVGSSLVSRLLHRSWRPRRAGGLQWRQHVCRARGVAAGRRGGSTVLAEREPWRRDAEVQCLNAGTVREGPGIVRIRSIQGPGVCGADFPFKVSTLGESSPLGYTDALRPPSDIPGRPGSAPARWPIRPSEPPPVQQQPPYQSRVLPQYPSRPVQPPPSGATPDQPVSLEPPSVTDRANGVPATYDFRRPYGASPAPRYRSPAENSPRDDFSPEPYERRPLVDAPATSRDAPGGIARTPLREPL